MAVLVLEESLALKRDIDDRRGIAQSLGNLGMIACAQARLEHARSLQEECLQISREIGDRQSIAWSLGNLADVLCRQNDQAQAWADFVESLQIYIELQEKRSILGALYGLGVVAYHRGNLEEATQLMGICDSLLGTIDVALLPKEAQDREELLHSLRQKLGSPGFEAAWNVGVAMSLDQGIAYATGLYPAS